MSQFKDVLETATRLFIEDDDSFTVEECVENAILLCREVEEQLDAEVEQGGPDPEPIEYPETIYEPSPVEVVCNTKGMACQADLDKCRDIALKAMGCFGFVKGVSPVICVENLATCYAHDKNDLNRVLAELETARKDCQDWIDQANKCRDIALDALLQSNGARLPSEVVKELVEEYRAEIRDGNKLIEENSKLSQANRDLRSELLDAILTKGWNSVDTSSYEISCSIDAGDYLRVWENTPPTAMIEVVEKKTVANIGLDRDRAKKLGQWLLSWAAKRA